MDKLDSSQVVGKRRYLARVSKSRTKTKALCAIVGATFGTAKKLAVLNKFEFDALKSTFRNMYIVHFGYQLSLKHLNLTTHTLAISFMDEWEKIPSLQ